MVVNYKMNFITYDYINEVIKCLINWKKRQNNNAQEK